MVYVDHIFIPSIWMLLILAPQKLYQIHVDCFRLSIFLCMECFIPLQHSVHLSQSEAQNLLINLVSLSEMMLLGILKFIQTCLKNTFVASYPLMAFLLGIRTHILLNLSPTKKKSMSLPSGLKTTHKIHEDALLWSRRNI